MKKILVGTRYLRAGDMDHTNDPRETVDAFIEIDGAEHAAVLENAWSQMVQHIACFSPDSELTNQWKAYADKCRGCAIGFDRVQLEEWCWSQTPPLTLYAMTYDLSRVIEMRKHYVASVREIHRRLLPNDAYASPALIEFLSNGSAAMWLQMFPLIWKNNRSAPEHEWRVRRMTHKSQPVDPFTRLEICTPDLVTEVVIGSRFTADAEALRRDLDGAGLSSVTIRRSSCQCPESEASPPLGSDSCGQSGPGSAVID